MSREVYDCEVCGVPHHVVQIRDPDGRYGATKPAVVCPSSWPLDRSRIRDETDAMPHIPSHLNMS